MSPAAQVNGDSPTNSPSSAFLSHLVSYPLISDSISTIQNNPIGHKGIELSQKTYSTFASPIIPYLQKPYQYAAPYVAKADSIGDSTLSKVDEKFPVVKKPTGELYNNGVGIVFFPLNKGLEGRDYVLKTYSSEVKKTGGDSLVTKGKALVSTGLVVTSDALAWLGAFLGEKKEQAKEVTNEKM